MPFEPTVAVVVPCHNYGRFLADALDSVLAQTRPADEIVVIDDGSTDDTAAVAARFAPKVRLVRQEQRGLAGARNRGAAEVSTTHVVFLDADDRLAPRYVEACVDALAGNRDVDFVGTQMQLFGTEDGVSTLPPWSVRRLLDENMVHASALVPLEAVRRFGYDERIRRGLEDWDFYLSLAEHGMTGLVLDEPLLLYRRHEQTMTGSMKRGALRWHLLNARLVAKHRRLYGRKHALRRLNVIRQLAWRDVKQQIKGRVQ